jgi:hypothetical protein
MITTRAIAVLCAAVLAMQNSYAFPQQQQPAGAPQNDSQKLLTPGQLDSLVAPIALYPDPILSQALVASTYPIEIVEAGRWLSAHSNLKDKALTEAAAKQPWDASVQALVVLPDVLKRLDQDVGWTADLGNAFLAQQQDVMDAVQRLRQKASAAGALQSTKEQTVTTATENNQTYIEIEPASTQVVYVPQYNPVAVWGPPLEYPYPPIYYPQAPSTGAIVAASAISFGVGMAVGAIWTGGGGWGGYGWGCGWGRGNNVVINNNFISSNHFNRVNVGNGNNWVHNPAHRGNVPYNNRNVANRYQGVGRSAATRPSVGQTQQRLNQATAAGRGAGAIGQRGGGGMPNQNNASRLGSSNNGRGPVAGQQPAKVGPGGGGGIQNKGSASRMSQRPAQGGGDRIGNRSMPSGGGNRGAFGGMNQGGNRARMDSNRGAMSRGGGGRRR